VTINILLLLLL